jgi:hypothetical protein
MFPGTTCGKPINLDSFARWQLRPVLNHCVVCEKHPVIHRKQTHKFERDTSLPPFKGWHAFRRGNATLLASEKNLEAAVLMLRHAATAVTDRHYNLNTKQDKRATAAKEHQGREQRKEEAAGTLGAAFRQAVN